MFTLPEQRGMLAGETKTSGDSCSLSALTKDPPLRWDLSSLFKNEDEWRVSLQTLKRDFHDLARFHSRLLTPESLYECLEAYQIYHELAGRLETYAMLRSAEDTLDQRAQMMQDECSALRSEIESLASFIEPSILTLGWDVLEAMLQAHPPLEKYRFYLENIERARSHTLSAEVEAALATMSPQSATPYEVYRGITEQDLRFSPIVVNGVFLPVNHGNAEAYLESTDPEVRRLAYNSYADGYISVKNSVAASFVGQIKSSLAEARVRHFGSTFERLLFDQQIGEDVYRAAVETCFAHQHVFQRYFQVRAAHAEQKTIGEHDIFAPFSLNRRSIPYLDGVQMIVESLSPLGPRYQDILRRGLLEDGWADVEPRERKDSCQFSGGSYRTKPYLMTSYNGSIIDVSTLAHEAGHSVHTQLTNESQPACYFDYVMIVAETASNLNQVLLRDRIFAQGDRELSLTALDDAFCFMHRYLFLMPILSFIERRAHDEYAAGRSVSLDDLCDWTRDEFTKAYGQAVSCDSERIGVKWAQFAHLYEPGYPFQYIVGISAALVLGKRLQAGEPGLRERYEQFLRAGASMPPADIFQIVGIDIASPALYEAAFAEVERHTQILQTLLRAS